MVRLGGPVFGQHESPDHWALSHVRAGYRAAVCPIETGASDTAVRDYVRAAARVDLMIAEVGAWSNPIDPDSEKARQNVAYCIERLALAESLGARCCVNISGSRNPEQWDASHPDNFSEETFELIVETTRCIIDAVNPTRTYYVLETMPWAFPSSPDEYLRLIQAVDRPALGVHLDPVNLVTSPAIAYDTGKLIRECFRTLGSHIQSAHAKDVVLGRGLTVQLSEVRPGLGVLDYSTFLRLLGSLETDTPLIMEHLKTPGEYRLGAEYIRGVARHEGVRL